MSQSIKSENASTLKPIEDILESLSFSKKTTPSQSFTAPQASFMPTGESITSSLAFKIIIILIILLVGIIGYTYLEKEINQMIKNIQNYFETQKYKKLESEELEKQKEIEKENTPKEQSTEDVIKDVQTDIEENKKNKNKNKKEEPVNYTSSTKLNVSALEETEDVEEYQKDALKKALNDAAQSGGEVMPDTAESHGKKGWCFIGAEKMARTCAEIGVNDVCMSGEIYPTKAVCINPNLRA